MRVSGLVTTIRLYMCVYQVWLQPQGCICACIEFGYNHKVVYVRVLGLVTTIRLYMCVYRVWLQP